MANDITALLHPYEDDLGKRLGEVAGLEGSPEDGSVATLLIESLTGLPPDVYIQRFEDSGRALAMQDGRLEVRLQGIHRWSSALAQVLGEQFATDPEMRAQALAALMEITSRAAVAITMGGRPCALSNQTTRPSTRAAA